MSKYTDYLNNLKKYDNVYYHHTNGFIYKGSVDKTTKTTITVKSKDYATKLDFDKKTGIAKGFPSSIYITDESSRAVKINNKKMKRYYAPKALEYIGGKLCFDKTPIDDLTSVQQGLFEDFIGEIPSVSDLGELEDNREAVEELAELYDEVAGLDKEQLKKWAEHEGDDDQSPIEVFIEKMGNILESWDII